MNHASHNHDDAAKHAHPGNPVLQHEHAVLLDLMYARANGAGADEAGVAKAVKDGLWSDPDTWGGVDSMPKGNMSVVIPEGISVFIDNDPGPKLMSVVIYGGLGFDPNADVTMYVDEILTAPGSVLHLGTQAHPVTGNINIIIREDTPPTTDSARLAIDPTQLGKGIVAHGTTRMEGKEKVAHLKVIEDPMAGDTSLQFADEPFGWEAGDKIIITGSHIIEIPENDKVHIRYGGASVENGVTTPEFLADIEKDFASENSDPAFVAAKMAAFDISDENTWPEKPGDWRLQSQRFETQDETRYVDEVTQNEDGTWTVTFTNPDGPSGLVYNHDAPKGVGNVEQDLFISVGNYSRNITIKSEVAMDDDGEVGDWAGMEPDQLHLRGHTMFMHNDDVEVRYAGFEGLGRTDKTIPIDQKMFEWYLQDHGGARWNIRGVDEDGEFARGSNMADRDALEIENHAGRYAFHFHKTGTLQHKPGEKTLTDDPALVQGISIIGSPGWGLVHHDSHANVLDNVLYNIDGGGIVSESGNETGKWNGNLVVKTSGTSATHLEGPPGRRNLLDDSFHGGDAYGFESKYITSENNIAASSMGISFKFVGSSNDHRLAAPSDGFLAAQGYDPFWGIRNVDTVEAPNRTFVSNESYASDHSFGSTLDRKFLETETLTVVDTFHSWHSNEGAHLHYASGYLFKDNIFIGDTTAGDERQNGLHGRSDAGEVHVVNSYFKDLYSDSRKANEEMWAQNTSINVERRFVSDAVQEVVDRDGIYIPSLHPGVGRATIVTDDVANLPQDAQYSEIVLTETDLHLDSWKDRASVKGVAYDAFYDGSYDIQGPKSIMNPDFNKSSGSGTWGSHWNHYITREGYFEDENGKKFVIVHLALDSSVSGTAAVQPAAISLEDDFLLPPEAVFKGPLPFGLSDDKRIGDPIIMDLRELGKAGNQLSPEEVQARLATPPAPGFGQFAWEFDENYQRVHDGKRSLDKGHDERGRPEMLLLETDFGTSRIELRHPENVSLGIYENGAHAPLSLADLVGGRIDGSSDIRALIEYAIMHSGKGDIDVAAGGMPGDGEIVLILKTPERDFLKIEGALVGEIIADFHAAHPGHSDGTGDGGDPVDPDPVDPVDPDPVRVNAAPVAADDSGFTEEEGAPFEISVADLLANDTDADGDSLSITSVDGASLSDDGQTITVNSDAAGAGQFTYTVTDGTDTSAPATVYYEVTAPPPPPPADDPDPDDDMAGFRARHLAVQSSVRVLSDIDFDADPIHEEIVQEVQYDAGRSNAFYDGGRKDDFAVEFTGNLTIETAGQYTFWLRSDDGSKLMIGDETLGNDGLHAARTQSFTIDLAAGSYPLELQYFERGGHAVVELDWAGPDTGGTRIALSGEAVSTSALPDGDVDPVDPDPVPVNAAPVAADDGGFTAEEGTPFVISALDLLANDTDADGDSLSIASVDGASLSDDGQAITVNSNTAGTGQFTYTVTDGTDTSAPATVDYEVTTSPPTDDPDTGGGDTLDDGPLRLTKPITEVAFESRKVLSGESRFGVTTVEIGPDGNVYASDVFGTILRYNIDQDTGLATSTTVVANLGQTITGMIFDPGSTADDMTLWASSYKRPADPFTSKISKIDLSDGSVDDVITGLPNGGHGVNGIAFGPDGVMYIAAGGLASNGGLERFDSWVPETLLSAAVLKADVNGNAAFASGPVNVRTDGSNPYDPYASDAPVAIHATGVRNIYDLEWTKDDAGNDILVTGDNGNSVTDARTPDDPDTNANESIRNIKPPEKFIVVEEGGYYGHPNPERGEYILNGGNPTAGNDPWQISNYQVGTQAEAGFDPDGLLNLDQHDADSPNGIDTYIDGTILQTTFSGGRKILYMNVDENGRPQYEGDLQQVGGGDLRFSAPLDIAVDDATGRIYVANFGNNQGNPSNGSLFLITPEEGALTGSGASGDTQPPPADPPEEPPVFNPGDTVRLEAETMLSSGDFSTQSLGSASGGEIASFFVPGGPQIVNPEGFLQARFSGDPGTYDVTVGYYDENDGAGSISVVVAGQQVGLINLTETGGSGARNAASFRTTKIENVDLQPGLSITLTGIKDDEEYVGIDYIELTKIADADDDSGGFTPPNANTAPVALDDDTSLTFTEGDPILIPVDELLMNDTDADGDMLSIQHVTGGTVAGDMVEVDPRAPGTGQISYTVTDGMDQSNEAIAMFEVVEAQNDDPIDDAPQTHATIWFEDFEGLSNGARSDSGDTAWFATTSPSATLASHGVSNGAYRLSETTRTAGDNSAVTTWRTEVIDTSDADALAIELDLFSSSGMEAGGDFFDFVTITAEVDGARTELFSQDGDGGFANQTQSLAFALSVPGSELVLEVEAKTTWRQEFFSVDNIEVIMTDPWADLG